MPRLCEICICHLYGVSAVELLGYVLESTRSSKSTAERRPTLYLLPAARSAKE